MSYVELATGCKAPGLSGKNQFITGLFQMEITRRIAQGRISEFAGESTLKKDIFLRAVGFYDIAKRHQEKLSPGIRRYFQRYVDGINFFIQNEKAPLYLKLLGLKSEKWEIADATSVAMMLITGNNEYFLSPHRTDMTDAWLQREYFCMEEESPKYTMVMMPGG